MASDIGSWIANAFIQHDKKHGSNFTIPWQGNRYCQIVQVSPWFVSCSCMLSMCKSPLLDGVMLNED